MMDTGYRVVTRYHGPTNTAGARITVRLANGRVARIPYDHAADNAHQSAVHEAFGRWGVTVQDIQFVDSARGGRGNVYTVTVNTNAV